MLLQTHVIKQYTWRLATRGITWQSDGQIAKDSMLQMKARFSFLTESLEAQSGGATAQKDDPSADASMSIARAALESNGLLIHQS